MVEEQKSSSPQNDPEEKLGGGDQGITFDDLMNEYYVRNTNRLFIFILTI